MTVAAAPCSLATSSALSAGQIPALGVPVASLRAKAPLACTRSQLSFCSQGACVACQGQGLLREEDTVWSTPRRKKSCNIHEKEGLRLVVQGIAWG